MLLGRRVLDELGRLAAEASKVLGGDAGSAAGGKGRAGRKLEKSGWWVEGGWVPASWQCR